MALIFRLGAGINLMHGTNNGNQNTGSIFTWIPSVGAGISFRRFAQRVYNFRWITYGALYFEIGVEYTHLFSKDSPTGYIKPSLGAGLRF
jgi:hypothetical protein